MATDTEKSKSLLAVIRASRPYFRNKHDKVAFAVHASFLAAGFVLTATGPPAFSDNALSNSDEVGIENWNEVDDEYAFVYLNPDKGNRKVLVKCLVMGDKLLVDALNDGAPEPVHLEISVDDYNGDDGAKNYEGKYKNLGKLLNNIDSEIFSKLDGPAPGAGASSSNRGATSSQSRGIVDLPATGFTEPQGPPHIPGVLVPPINPVGGSDLYPGPGAGMYPSRGDFGGGSMLVGPNDPRWFGGGGIGGQPQFPGGPRMPPGMVPGARFDPFGPPGVPGFEPDRFTRFPRGPGGGPHPDLEQPGRDDFI